MVKGYRVNSTFVRDIYDNLTPQSSSDQWRDAGEKFIEKYFASSMLHRRSILIELSQNFGVDHSALKRSIELYHKNQQAFMTVASAARPHYSRLFQSIGNVIGGVKRICSMRADVLEMLRSSDLTRTASAALRPIENCFRELLTLWFCQSNLRLQQLTIESPIDILDKVMIYEAVHPITGLMDMKRRLGPNRRCFVFMHEAMDREPLMVIYVAFMKKIAKNLEDLINDIDILEDENACDTAIFYSISSIQAGFGLRGIDLGNMLIKRVIAEISNTNPHIHIFATLSPMPCFRSWLLRSLKCAAPSGKMFELLYQFGFLDEIGYRLLDVTLAGRHAVLNSHPAVVLWQCDIIDERLLAICDENDFFESDSKVTELVRLFLLDHLNKIDGNKSSVIIFMGYVVENLLATQSSYALSGSVSARNKNSSTGRVFDPVENFHLRNGAEIYAINWKADTTTKGMESSYGMMVNYLYRLDQMGRLIYGNIFELPIAVNLRISKFQLVIISGYFESGEKFSPVHSKGEIAINAQALELL
ncbi:Malonyl-CoA decarboxylase, mitochondrial [Dirofilaria immitis]|nr:Malonyl-CoA decarboxylase, mitochondrial [Dirofilaria immitis]